MAIALVQQKSGTGSSLSFTNPTTAGNCVVVGYTDSQGATGVSTVKLGGVADHFAQVAQSAANPGGKGEVLAALWADPNCAGGQTAVTVTPTGTASAPTIWIAEFSGIVLSSPVDKTSPNSGTSDSWSSNSTATTSQGNELWIGACCTVSLPTGPSSPWNNTVQSDGAGDNQLFGYQITASTGAAVYSGTGAGSSGWAAVVGTLLGVSSGNAVTTPQVRLGTTAPYPLSVNGQGHVLIPQNPANKPNVYVRGISATENVSANFGSVVVSKTGLVSGESVKANSGQFYIQVPYNIPAPFPGTSPYPFSIIPRPFVIQPQIVAGTATPPTVVNGLTAQDTVVAPAGNTQIILQGIYSWSFPFGNNLPNPLRITYRNLKPSIQGQPQVFIAKPGVPNVSATAPAGTVKISPSVSANENVVARFGNIYIASITSQPLPFTNYPSRFKLRNMRPDYSSGKQWLPTNIHGLTANEIAVAYYGSPSIGRAVDGFVSNVFAATVPGITVNKEIEPTANVGVAARLGAIKNTASGITSHETTSANAGTIAIKIPGPVSRENVNPEFGRISAGRSFAGNVSAVTSVANIGHPTVSLSKVAGVTVVSVQGHTSVSFTKNNINVAASARLGTITISQANLARVAVASVVSKKVSVSGITAKVTSGSVSRPKISVSPQPALVAIASSPGTRTSLGQTSSISVIANIGTVKIIIPAHVSGVTVKANNQGKAVAGLTATSHSIAIAGNISTSVNINGKVTVAAHMGTGGESRLNVKLVRRYGISAEVIRPTVVG